MPMLTPAELHQAERLFEKLREITAPAVPEFTKDGQELATLLRCSRTKEWQISKRPDFNARRRRSLSGRSSSCAGPARSSTGWRLRRIKSRTPGRSRAPILL